VLRIERLSAQELHAVLLRAPDAPRTEQTVWLTASAAVAPSGSFGGIAYSGGVVNYDGEQLAIDLDEISLPSSGRIPLLMNHNTNRIAGHAGVSVSDGVMHIRDGKFSNVTEAGREAAGLRSEGQPLSLSAGVIGKRHRLQRPTALVLNHRMQTVETILRKCRLLEVSIVPAGADPEAGIA
jgi:hypothetical protein